MNKGFESAEHYEIKTQLLEVAQALGYETFTEYRGQGWRADVFALTPSQQVAFEVQLSPQSLTKTLEHQERYRSAGVQGCWLVQKPIHKLSDERPDLPVFKVSKHHSKFVVLLGDRRDVPLAEFARGFLADDIKFCNMAKTSPQQKVKIVFYEMDCWKCPCVNHLYFVDDPFRSSCGAALEPEEVLWGSARQEHRPEIVKAVRAFIASDEGAGLLLGDIKQRHSKTVDEAYLSFGCYACDRLFGDFYVRDAEMEARFDYGVVARAELTIALEQGVVLPAPHWCFPEDNAFCEDMLKYAQ